MVFTEWSLQIAMVCQSYNLYKPPKTNQHIKFNWNTYINCLNIIKITDTNY